MKPTRVARRAGGAGDCEQQPGDGGIGERSARPDGSPTRAVALRP